MSDLVIVIIVNWNGKADTLECLESLRGATYPAKHVIVVDNGSTDDSVIKISSEFPEVELICAGKNLGFSGGNNLGFKRAIEKEAAYIFALNNDTICRPEAISNIVEAAKCNRQFGLLTPLVNFYDHPEEPWFAGSSLDLSRGEALHVNSSPPAPSESIRELPWASGCAMLFRRELLVAVGGFDDRFFASWEDVDISIRARATGWKIGLVANAVIYHKVGRSFANAWGLGTYYTVRNQLLVLSMHIEEGCFKASIIVIVRHMRRAIRSFWYREPRSFQAFGFVLRGCVDHLRRRYGPYCRLASIGSPP